MKTNAFSLVCASFLAVGAAVAAPKKPFVPQIPPLVVANPAEPGNWKGGTADTTVTREGIPVSIRWEHGKNNRLNIAEVPANWKGGWNAVDFWMYSHRATGARFLLYIGSENPNTEGSDYYSTTIKADFEGWRHFTFECAQLGIARTPLGWDHITSLSFTASGWGNTPNPETIVNFGPISLIEMPPVIGPLTSDEEFFGNVLNLDYPGLEEVKKAVAANDLEAATHAYVTYLKTRETPKWYFDWRKFNTPEVRVPNFNTKPADDICNNLLSSCGIPCQFGEKIDWKANPTKLKYNEWTWQLSRHPFWVTLGRAYWATGDEKYAQAYVRQIRSWIEDNPLPNNAANGAYSRWRTIETGIRTAGPWPNAFFYFLGSPSFDDDSIVMVVKSFYEHALHNHDYPQHNNWLCMEMNGLYHVGTLFPEFKRSPEFRDFAGTKLYNEMNIQVYPDGAQVELAPGYHGVSLSNFLGTYNIAKLNNLPLPGDYMARLERMYAMYLNVCSPSHCMPALNDSGWGNVTGSLKQGAALFPHRTDFLYIGTNGEEGTLPTFTSTWMPYAGWYNMRNGWGREDIYMNFDAGPFGDGHQHEDKLSFIIEAYGSRILTESGSYAYDTSQWRRYAISARAHNIVRVDGQDQNRRSTRDHNLSKEPLPNRWVTNDHYDFAEGWYNEGYGKDRALQLTQARSILFVKQSPTPYWLVFDVMTPNDTNEHEYTSWFHYNVEKAIRLPEINGLVSDSPTTSNLVIAPLTADNGLKLDVISGQEEPEVQGWVPAQGYDVRPVATATFIRKATGQHLEAYIFLPLKAEQASPIKAITRNSNGSFVIAFNDGTKDTVAFAPNADGTAKFLKLLRNAADGSVLETIAVE